MYQWRNASTHGKLSSNTSHIYFLYLFIVIPLLLPDVNTRYTVLMKNTVKVKVVLNGFIVANSAVNMAY